MCPEESLLKTLPALLDSLAHEDSFQGCFVDLLSEELEFSFPKVSLPDFTLHLSQVPLEHELNHSMVTTVQAASNPDVTKQFIYTGKQQVQYYIPPGEAINYLTQEAILSAF